MERFQIGRGIDLGVEGAVQGEDRANDFTQTGSQIQFDEIAQIGQVQLGLNGGEILLKNSWNIE